MKQGTHPPDLERRVATMGMTITSLNQSMAQHALLFAQMMARMAHIEGDITDIKRDIVDMKRDIADLKGDVADLKRDVADIKAVLAQIVKLVTDQGSTMIRGFAESKKAL